MATRKYEMISNDNKAKIVVSVGSSVTKDIEVTIDMATVSRFQASRMLHEIAEKVLEGTWETT